MRVRKARSPNIEELKGKEDELEGVIKFKYLVGII